jgi:type I restriction enzyme S subunit
MAMGELPEGWELTALPTAFDLNPGHYGKKIKNDTLVSFVPMTKIEEKTGRFDASETRPYKDVKKNFTKFIEGDVIFAKITPCMENGKIALASGLKNGIGCGTTELHVFRPKNDNQARYLFYFLLQDSLRSKAKENFQGTSGHSRVPISFFEEMEFPLPNPTEQRHIVKKLDHLMPKLEACRARLDTIPSTLKRFRQAILSAACSGRLTEDWRQKNTSAEPTATTLGAIQRKREASAKTPAQKEKLRAIFSIAEEGDSPELPNTWQFVALCKICDSFDYGTSAKSQPAGKVPVLRMGNIQDGKLDWTDLVYTSNKEEIQKYALSPNTVLFNRTNSPELVGKTAIYRGEQPAIFAGYLIRINNLPELDPNYLNFCLNTMHARDFCAQVKTDGVSQSNINAQKLGTFEIPFCCIEEQREIVRRVEALFKKADAIQARYEQARKVVDALPQAILAKAFRGELLVPAV